MSVESVIRRRSKDSKARARRRRHRQNANTGLGPKSDGGAGIIKWIPAVVVLKVSVKGGAGKSWIPAVWVLKGSVK